ncbi:DUF937 domain-containing protein [Vitreoscilla stercoraria]|uniref:DUF937 domain-containing protein n=1 Tax=Vitreoscilla stercoraria TaxID=61 RepID=A0ABY4EDB8_VITST|nr:DUF937 domain-containing protein [Vitreoscilla stercoraria]UOO92925.1 DUF937 domain-containing protein [Vitreoscilla stercoraria]
MAAHLQEVLAQYVGPILVQYAQNHVGLEQAASFKAVEKSIPAVLAGVISHVRDEHAAKRFFNLLTGTNVDTQWLKPEILQHEDVKKVVAVGRQWMGLLFGHQAAEVQNAVAQDADLNPDQAGDVLAFAIPAVLASLKQYIQSNQYGQHQFYGQLVAQESFFAKIFSPKLLAAIGIPSASALVAGVRTWGDSYFTSRPSGVAAQQEEIIETAARTTPPPVEETVATVSESSNNGWVKWLLALMVVGIAAWLAYTYLLPQPQNNQTATPVAASAPQIAPKTIASDVVAASAVAASTPVAASMPAAASAVVDEHNPIDRVVAEADVLKFYFATGSAKIAPEAKEAAAAMLAAAKEGKKLVVSGFNDATGKAESNEWLAKKRAQAVRSFLRNSGVPAAQIELVKPQKMEGQSGASAEERCVEVRIAAE